MQWLTVGSKLLSESFVKFSRLNGLHWICQKWLRFPQTAKKKKNENQSISTLALKQPTFFNLEPDCTVYIHAYHNPRAQGLVGHRQPLPPDTNEGQQVEGALDGVAIQTTTVHQVKGNHG